MNLFKKIPLWLIGVGAVGAYTIYSKRASAAGGTLAPPEQLEVQPISKPSVPAPELVRIRDRKTERIYGDALKPATTASVSTTKG